MNTRAKQQLLIALCTLTVPLTATAHTFGTHGAGFMQGIMHPLSGLDHLLLKMLYDPRIKPGMNEKTALPVLKTIAAEYERDRAFADADRDAAESGLARLMP